MIRITHLFQFYWFSELLLKVSTVIKKKPMEKKDEHSRGTGGLQEKPFRKRNQHSGNQALCKKWLLLSSLCLTLSSLLDCSLSTPLFLFNIPELQYFHSNFWSPFWIQKWVVLSWAQVSVHTYTTSTICLRMEKQCDKTKQVNIPCSGKEPVYCRNLWCIIFEFFHCFAKNWRKHTQCESMWTKALLLLQILKN